MPCWDGEAIVSALEYAIGRLPPSLHPSFSATSLPAYPPVVPPTTRATRTTRTTRPKAGLVQRVGFERGERKAGDGGSDEGGDGDGEGESGGPPPFTGSFSEEGDGERCEQEEGKEGKEMNDALPLVQLNQAGKVDNGRGLFLAGLDRLDSFHLPSKTKAKEDKGAVDAASGSRVGGGEGTTGDGEGRGGEDGGGDGDEGGGANEGDPSYDPSSPLVDMRKLRADTGDADVVDEEAYGPTDPPPPPPPPAGTVLVSLNLGEGGVGGGGGGSGGSGDSDFLAVQVEDVDVDVDGKVDQTAAQEEEQLDNTALIGAVQERLDELDAAIESAQRRAGSVPEGSLSAVGGVTEDGATATGPMAKRAVVVAPVGFVPVGVAPVVAPHLCRGISRTGNIGSDLLRMLREHRMRAILPLYLKTRKKMSSANRLHSRPEFQAFKNSM